MRNFTETLAMAAFILACLLVIGGECILGLHAENEGQVARAECEVSMAVLKNAKDAGILDANGIAKYEQYTKAYDLDGMMALVSECEAEENFDDTVGETDVYQLYCIFAHENVEHGGEIVAHYLGYHLHSYHCLY